MSVNVITFCVSVSTLVTKVTLCPFPVQQFRQCDIPFMIGNHTDRTLHLVLKFRFKYWSYHIKPVNIKGVWSTCAHKTSCIQNQIRVHSLNSFKGLSQEEKLAALEYSFNLIYKYLTWAASENSSKCLFFQSVFSTE